MNKWPTYLLFLLAVLLVWRFFSHLLQPTSVSTPGDPIAADWIYYQSTEDHFEIQLPHEPVIKRESFGLQSNDEMRINLYAAAGPNEEGYIVRVVHYKEVENLHREDFLLQVVYQILHIDRDNLLKDLEETSVQGRPAYAFTIRDGTHYLGNLVVQQGMTIYLISYLEELSQFDEKRFARYWQTFQLLE
jgi:hypothetical protein